MTGLDLTVLILATQRLTNLWFEKIAEPLHNRAIAKGGQVAYLANCRLCVSVWAAAVLFGVWQVTVLHPLVWVLALSGGVLMLETAVLNMANNRR